MGAFKNSPLILRQARWLALCAIFFAGVIGERAAAADLHPLLEREFWVWDLSVMPPGFRRANASNRYAGGRAMIFVEDSLWGEQIKEDYVRRLGNLLEFTAPSGAYRKSVGVIGLEELLFGSLPKRADRDDRLIVLFADLGKYREHEFDGFFNAYDQMSEAEAQAEGQHSNEANILYINGFRRNEAYTNGVIAHELQHLLAHSKPPKDNWLSETLAEGAMLLTGFFTDQPHVNRYFDKPESSTLVSNSYVQYGPQALFASFLIDSASRPEFAMKYLTEQGQGGRSAVEELFQDFTGTPQNFDLIYGNFLSYLFALSGTKETLPMSWRREPGQGLTVPPLSPHITVPPEYPVRLNGSLLPYTFLVVDLPAELPPSAVVNVQAVPPPVRDQKCASTAGVLWKPVNKKRIAIYSVGCEPKSKNDTVQFRLTILDKPFLPQLFPLRLAP